LGCGVWVCWVRLFFWVVVFVLGCGFLWLVFCFFLVVV
jgi:hypothetical protein